MGSIQEKIHKYLGDLRNECEYRFNVQYAENTVRLLDTAIQGQLLSGWEMRFDNGGYYHHKTRLDRTYDLVEYRPTDVDGAPYAMELPRITDRRAAANLPFRLEGEAWSLSPWLRFFRLEEHVKDLPNYDNNLMSIISH